MILLEVPNRILEETILSRFQAQKREAVDITLADFDGATYHVSTNAQQRNILTVSINWGLISELKRLGLDAQLKRIYGPLLRDSPEPGYDVSLEFDVDGLSAEQKGTLPRMVALLKRHIIAVPFHTMSDAVASGNVSSVPPLVALNYRMGESMYIKPEGDRLTVIFSISFKDGDDISLSKVFLKEFEDARKTISNSPAVLFSLATPPLELRGAPGVVEGPLQGFVSFALFKGHISKEKRERTIDHISMFRNYLQYHIKCSRAFMHTRMRVRVESLLLVLNRAKQKKAAKPTTADGRTFKRGGEK